MHKFEIKGLTNDMSQELWMCKGGIKGSGHKYKYNMSCVVMYSNTSALEAGDARVCDEEQW